MKIKEIYYSSHFQAVFKKLPRALQKKALQKERIFRADCFDARLKTHKLKGELAALWSFSIDYSHRILFEFMEKGAIGFIDIGDHKIYK